MGRSAARIGRREEARVERTNDYSSPAGCPFPRRPRVASFFRSSRDLAEIWHAGGASAATRGAPRARATRSTFSRGRGGISRDDRGRGRAGGRARSPRRWWRCSSPCRCRPAARGGRERTATSAAARGETRARMWARPRERSVDVPRSAARGTTCRRRSHQSAAEEDAEGGRGGGGRTSGRCFARRGGAAICGSHAVATSTTPRGTRNHATGAARGRTRSLKR